MSRSSRSNQSLILCITCLLGLGIADFSAQSAAEFDRVTRPPIFSSEQADIGRKVYREHCQSCHGAALEGASGPALSGTRFSELWAKKPVAALLSTISSTMPLSAPGSLSTKNQYSIVAYLLSKNGILAGNTLLSRANASVIVPAIGTGHGAPAAPITRLPSAAKYYGHATTSDPADVELLNADASDWVMANRDYRSQRYSQLSQINRDNAAKLQPVCVLQLGLIGAFSSNPVVYHGIVFVTAQGSTWAINGATCKTIWKYDYLTDEQAIVTFNRGVALYRGALYRTTPTGHLIALNMNNGKLLWDVWLSSVRKGYWLSVAPVVFDGKVFVGEAGADAGAPGHLYAFNAATGNLLWTFNYIPAPGESGSDTWKAGAEHGGGSNWTSYSIDPVMRLIYAPVGNPAPDLFTSARPGSNLYTDSVVAVNEDTGKLQWFAQQLANDAHDWDTAAAPVLYEQGGRQFMAVANKGGWMYIYDRNSHRLITRSEISTHVNVTRTLTSTGTYVCPGIVGGVDWNGPAYSPKDSSLFVGSVEWCGVFKSKKTPFQEGSLYGGGSYVFDPRERARGWIRAFDAVTGRQKWVVATAAPVVAGATPTAGGIVFSGLLNGDFWALDAGSGNVLYRFFTGGPVAGGIATYGINGKQYVAVESGNASRTWQDTGSPSLFIFALPAH